MVESFRCRSMGRDGGPMGSCFATQKTNTLVSHLKGSKMRRWWIAPDLLPTNISRLLARKNAAFPKNTGKTFPAPHPKPKRAIFRESSSFSSQKNFAVIIRLFCRDSPACRLLQSCQAYWRWKQYAGLSHFMPIVAEPRSLHILKLCVRCEWGRKVQQLSPWLQRETELCKH